MRTGAAVGRAGGQVPHGAARPRGLGEPGRMAALLTRARHCLVRQDGV